MVFFSKRFNYIGKQVERMRVSRRNVNRRLSRLIVEHNRVHCDLMLINDFFKFYVGFNLIGFFAFGVIMMFIVLLDIEWRLVNQTIVEQFEFNKLKSSIFILMFKNIIFRIKAAFTSIVLFFYLTIIIFPFVIAKSVINEVNQPA